MITDLSADVFTLMVAGISSGTDCPECCYEEVWQ